MSVKRGARMTEPSISATLAATFESLVGSIKTIGLVTGAVLVLFALVSFFGPHPLATFLKLMSLAGVALMLFSTAVMILTLKKARDLAPTTLLGSLAVTLLATFVSLAFMSFLPPKGFVILALLVGGGLGVLWSRTARLFVDGKRIRMRGTVWYLAVWALALALNQGFAAVTGRTPIAMTLLTIAGAGLAVGNTLAILWRARRAAAVLQIAGSSGHV